MHIQVPPPEIPAVQTLGEPIKSPAQPFPPEIQAKLELEFLVIHVKHLETHHNFIKQFNMHFHLAGGKNRTPESFAKYSALGEGNTKLTLAKLVPPTKEATIAFLGRVQHFSKPQYTKPRVCLVFWRYYLQHRGEYTTILIVGSFCHQMTAGCKLEESTASLYLRYITSDAKSLHNRIGSELSTEISTVLDCFLHSTSRLASQVRRLRQLPTTPENLLAVIESFATLEDVCSIFLLFLAYVGTRPYDTACLEQEGIMFGEEKLYIRIKVGKTAGTAGTLLKLDYETIGKPPPVLVAFFEKPRKQPFREVFKEKKWRTLFDAIAKAMNWGNNPKPYVLRHGFITRIMRILGENSTLAAAYSGHMNAAMIDNYYYKYGECGERMDADYNTDGLLPNAAEVDLQALAAEIKAAMEADRKADEDVSSWSDLQLE
jgi:hypothetical protein